MNFNSSEKNVTKPIIPPIHSEPSQQSAPTQPPTREMHALLSSTIRSLPPPPPPLQLKPTNSVKPENQQKSFLAEIRNAGGLKFLKSTSRMTKSESNIPDLMGDLKLKLETRRSAVMPELSTNISYIHSDSHSDSEYF